jgi:hypothetical protein
MEALIHRRHLDVPTMHFRHDATEPISKSFERRPAARGSHPRSQVQAGVGPLAECRPRVTINQDMEIENASLA